MSSQGIYRSIPPGRSHVSEETGEHWHIDQLTPVCLPVRDLKGYTHDYVSGCSQYSTTTDLNKITNIYREGSSIHSREIDADTAVVSWFSEYLPCMNKAT